MSERIYPASASPLDRIPDTTSSLEYAPPVSLFYRWTHSNTKPYCQTATLKFLEALRYTEAAWARGTRQTALGAMDDSWYIFTF